MGSGSEHELALSVGVVNLARQQGGQLVGPASGFIQEALTITSAVATVRRSTNQWKKQNNKNNNKKPTQKTCGDNKVKKKRKEGFPVHNAHLPDPRKASTRVVIFCKREVSTCPSLPATGFPTWVVPAMPLRLGCLLVNALAAKAEKKHVVM